MWSSSLRILRGTISWFVIAFEVLLGLLILVLLGQAEVYTHVPLVVVTTLLVGVGPILASFVATRNPRRAARILLWVSPLALLLLPRFGLGFRLAIAVLLGATVVPGLFWLFVSRRNWPLPLNTAVLPQRPGLEVVLVFGLLCTFLVSSVFLSLFLPWWPPIGDCGSGPLLNEQGAPRNIDFTARILFVGPRTSHGWSLWSIARVEQRFSDAPWSVAGLVVLRDFFRPTDRFERFFVEGSRSHGTFTRFLPIIERVECGHSQRTSDAIVALRVLRDGPPPSGIRIIGRVYADRLKHHIPSPGIEVLIKGPAGSRIVVTDAEGVYDVTGLSPGSYSVELSTKDWHPVCALDLQKVPVGDCPLFLDEARRPDI
jgi:hypothetical protein